jgi:two-component system response regulator CpxR
MYGSVEMLLKFYAENFSSDLHRRLRPRKMRVCTYAIILQGGGIRIGFRVTLHASSPPIGFSSLWLISQLQIFEIFARYFFRAPVEGVMKPKRTILCVDDNEQSLSIRKVMLETRGYRVLAFSDAQQALDRFAEGGVDLVLTDLVMPGVDGSKLIEGVKARSPETPAILLSGKVKVYEHETNADVFLAKGMYIPADLLERIRLLLVRKRGPKRAHARALTPTPNHRAASA